MRVLLAAINAKYIHTCLAVHSLKTYAQAALSDRTSPAAAEGTQAVAGNVPAAVADMQAAGGIAIETAEYTINQQLDDIYTDICAKKPDLLALSCYIWNVEQVKRLALLMHLADPDLPVWVGGPEVSYDAEAVLRENEGITGVITGEGERAFTELIASYAGSGSNGSPGADQVPDADAVSGADQVPDSDMAFLENVPGIVFRDRQGRIISHAAPPPLDLDTLVFPYPDLNAFAHRILYYESSRGCPFNCSYCLSSIDRQVRFKSLDKVFEELTLFLDAQVPLVKFVDRTFNCDHRRTRAIWQFIKDHDNQVTRFHFEITADLLDDAELDLLNTLRPGLVQLEIGVQSANPETLAAIDRSQNTAHLSMVTERIRRGENVHQHLDLIAGLPYEDLDSFSRSFDIVYEMNPSELQLGFLKLLKGSKMHRLRDTYGLKCRPWPPYEVVSTRWMPARDMRILKGIESMVEIYYNSGQFKTTLDYLMRFYERPWSFFEDLAAYVQEREAPGTQYTRPARYALLRTFVLECMIAENPDRPDPCQSDSGTPDELPQKPDPAVLDAVLLYDMYLRENLKSRPEWAPDPSAKDKERIGDFYADQEMRLRYLPGFAGDSVRQIRHETHLEIFRVNGREWAMLFDYRHRSPLDGAADVQEMDLPHEKARQA